MNHGLLVHRHELDVPAILLDRRSDHLEDLDHASHEIPVRGPIRGPIRGPSGVRGGRIVRSLVGGVGHRRGPLAGMVPIREDVRSGASFPRHRPLFLHDRVE